MLGVGDAFVELDRIWWSKIPSTNICLFSALLTFSGVSLVPIVFESSMTSWCGRGGYLFRVINYLIVGIDV